MTVLQTSGLRKVYGAGDTEVRALDGVDLTVESGEFVSADRREGERNECEHASGTWGRLGEGDDRPEMIGKGEIRGPVTGPQDHE